MGTSRGYYKMWYICVRVGLHAAEYVIEELNFVGLHDRSEESVIFVTGRKGTQTDCGHVGMYFGNPE